MSNSILPKKHWSIVEYLHKTVNNPNIHIRGKHSYYSNAWTDSFENSAVRYLYGDEYSLASWEPEWPIDQLYIGDYVCIGPEVVILMGGNHTHRMDWFSLYPFADNIKNAYIGKGDTTIADGVWIGMRSIIMAGVSIGEGAVIAAGSTVTKDIAPYTINSGNPAITVRHRFPEETINELLALKIYSWEQSKFNALKALICSNDITALKQAAIQYDQQATKRHI